MPGTIFMHLGWDTGLTWTPSMFSKILLQWQQTDNKLTTINTVTSDNDISEKFCEENTKL